MTRSRIQDLPPGPGVECGTVVRGRGSEWRGRGGRKSTVGGGQGNIKGGEWVDESPIPIDILGGTPGV